MNATATTGTTSNATFTLLTGWREEPPPTAATCARPHPSPLAPAGVAYAERTA